MTWLETARIVSNLTPDDFTKHYTQADPKTQVSLLRARFRFDRAAFLKWCFPRLFNRPFNRYHLDVLARPWPDWRQRTGRVWQEADAAPRGIAKTTLLKGEIAWAIVYGMESYLVWLSAELRLARACTRHLRNIFLATSGPLYDLYGPFVVKGGVDEWSVSVNGQPPIGVLARSFGTQFRGANEDAARPSLIVVDDGERPDRVRNPEQRRIWWEYLHEDVLKAGPIEGGLWVRLRGTVLHPDSLLANLLTSPAWEAAKYKVLNQLSGSPLWEKCRQIYCNLKLGNTDLRRECALAFYQANRAEMDAGLEVLDPNVMPVFRVYELIWTQGLQSVLKELFNEPRQSGSRFFDLRRFARCRTEGQGPGRVIVAADGTRIPLAACRLHMHLDPIPGAELGVMGEQTGSGGGDSAALAILARHPSGYGFLVRHWMARARDSEIRAQVWREAEAWGCQKLTVESNGFARLFARDFRRERAEREAKGQFWQLDVQEDVSTVNKEDRIASLEPPLHNGWLQLDVDIPQSVLLQFDDFPDADHDDGPDAIEGAWRLSRAGSSLASSITPIGRQR